MRCMRWLLIDRLFLGGTTCSWECGLLHQDGFWMGLSRPQMADIVSVGSHSLREYNVVRSLESSLVPIFYDEKLILDR